MNMIQQHQISSFRPDSSTNAPLGTVLSSNGSGGVYFSSVTQMAFGPISSSASNISTNSTYNFIPHTAFSSNIGELNQALSTLRLVNNSGVTRWYLFEFWPQFISMGSASWGKIDYAPTSYSGSFVNWTVSPSTIVPSGSAYGTWNAPYTWAFFGVNTGNTVELRVQMTVTTGTTTTLSQNSLWKLYRM